MLAPHLEGLSSDAQGRASVRDVLRAFLARAQREVSPDEAPYLELVEQLIASGSLAERLRAVLSPLVGDDDAFTEAARGIYIELADCLLDNEPWSGRGLRKAP